MASDPAAIKKFQDALAKMQAMKDAAKEVMQPVNMAKFGEQIRSMIKIRTRVGFSVDQTGSPKHPMKPLRPSTITQRNAMQSGASASGKHNGLTGHAKRDALHSAGGLYPETTPSKSNLTRTGQLLDSEAVKSVGVGRVTVGPTGNRSDSKHSNAEIAEFQEAQGRSYNKLSDIELKRLNDSVRSMIRSIMRDKLTK